MGARFKWLTESHSPRLRTAAESATEVSCCLEPHPCEVIRGNLAIHTCISEEERLFILQLFFLKRVNYYKSFT